MQAFHRVFRNTGILYVRMAITVFISLYATRLTLRALGVDDFGIFSVVGSTIAMLSFLNASMVGTTQRYMSFANGQRDAVALNAVFNTSIAIHAAIAVVVAVILWLAGQVLFEHVFTIRAERVGAARVVYGAAAASTFFAIIAVPYDAAINAREEMGVFALLSIVESLLKLAVALYIGAITSDRLEVYGVLIAFTAILIFAIKVAHCHVRYAECRMAPRSLRDRSLLKRMSAFAGWSFFGSSSSLVSYYGQGLVINSFFGPAVNSAQGVAAQVSGQLGAFAGTMLKALNPMIAKSEGAGDRQLMLEASMFGSKLSFFLLMVFYVPMLVEMPYVFDLWLGHTPQYAVIFCRLLLVRNLVEQLFFTLTASIAAVGEIKKYEVTSSLLTLVPLPVSWGLFAIGWPPYWIYIVYLVYAVLASAVILRFAATLCQCPVGAYLSRVVGRCMLALALCLASASAPALLLAPGPTRLAAVIAVSVLAFVAFVWTIGLDAAERRSVQSAAAGAAAAARRRLLKGRGTT